MQVKAITPRGYCKGVVRAIEIAKNAQNEQQPIYILGMIVDVYKRQHDKELFRQYKVFQESLEHLLIEDDEQ